MINPQRSARIKAFKKLTRKRQEITMAIKKNKKKTTEKVVEKKPRYATLAPQEEIEESDVDVALNLQADSERGK